MWTNENLNSENANFIKFDALNDTIDTSLLLMSYMGLSISGSMNLRPFVLCQLKLSEMT